MPRPSQLLLEYPKAIRAQIAANLPKAAEFAEGEFRKTCSRPGMPESPSRPGEAPHRITGVGLNSINVKASTARSRLALVLEANRYMAALNAGTSRVAARPWVAITINRAGEAIKARALAKS